MADAQKIHDDVSTAYAKAVSRPTEPQSCCETPVQKGTVVKIAGYDTEQLDTLPPEAVVNSFGCGNPLAFSQVREGQVVVDLGSGAGIDLLIASRKVGPAGCVIGVDMTDEMIAKARENVTDAEAHNVEIRKGFIEDLPVDSGTVDWVISNCVINLSPEKARVFSEIARVLKPGGQMLVSDIVVEDLPDWARENQELYSSCVAGAISESDYVAGLESAGLTDVEIRDRIVYDASQLKGFIKSDLFDSSQAIAQQLDGLGTAEVDTLIESFVGKIQSINVHARKPG